MTSVNQEPASSEPTDLITTPDASADLLADSFGDYLRIVSRRIRAGESGALPVIAGLVVIVIIFQVKNSLFLSAGNLVNLMAQSAFIITLGMAETRPAASASAASSTCTTPSSTTSRAVTSTRPPPGS
jgi:D-xylose transport system permease protein